MVPARKETVKISANTSMYGFMVRSTTLWMIPTRRRDDSAAHMKVRRPGPDEKDGGGLVDSGRVAGYDRHAEIIA